MRNPFIVGTRIYLRPLEVEDADCFLPWVNDPEIRKYLGMTSPTSRLREREYMENSIKTIKRYS